jgi:hypothetical protein
MLIWYLSVEVSQIRQNPQCLFSVLSLCEEMVFVRLCNHSPLHYGQNFVTEIFVKVWK